MVSRVSCLTVLMVAIGTILAVPAGAQEGADPQAEMQAYMEMIAPGPHHANLAKLAGSWTAASRFWMDPNQPPMETTGTSTGTMVMGGRFLEQTVKAEMMGMPWEGRGIYGYDNGTQKHVSAWYDAMGTMIMCGEGDCDGTCKTITTYSEYFDPMTQATKRMKVVSTMIDEDHYKDEMYDVAEDGTETRTVEVAYARAK